MVPTVQHYFCRCAEDPKNPEQSLAVLANLYRTLSVGQAVVFARSDKDAEMIREKLAKEGVTSFRLSGKVPAEERDRVVDDDSQSLSEDDDSQFSSSDEDSTLHLRAARRLVFISGIPAGTTADMLKEKFAKYNVIDVSIGKFNEGETRGFAFI